MRTAGQRLHEGRRNRNDRRAFRHLIVRRRNLISVDVDLSEGFETLHARIDFHHIVAARPVACRSLDEFIYIQRKGRFQRTV